MIVLRAHKIWSYGKTVAFSDIDATYTPAWAADAIPGRPVRGNAGGGVIDMTGSAGMVDCLVLSHTNLVAPATVAVSGDITASFTIPAARPNGITLNPFILLESPVSVDSLTFTIASNPLPLIIGEIIVGLSETLDILAEDNSFTYQTFPLASQDDTDLSSVPPMRGGKEQRTLTGSLYADAAQQLFLTDMLAATLENTRPMVVIPNPEDDDAWTCSMNMTIDYNQWRGTPRAYKTGFGFKEYLRKRWP